MKKNNIFFLLSFVLSSFLIRENITVDKQQAQKAFSFLNDIRTDPAKYYQEFNFLKKLRIRNTKLIWNDTLARVAEAKAYDMAKRNYFDHVDPDGLGINYFINKNGYKLNPAWVKEKKDNYFESIVAGSSDGENAIKILIIDDLVPSFGHRNHLLGIGSWNSSLVDVGIGFVRMETGGKYNTYVSLIIAKHDW